MKTTPFVAWISKSGLKSVEQGDTSWLMVQGCPSASARLAVVITPINDAYDEKWIECPDGTVCRVRADLPIEQRERRKKYNSKGHLNMGRRESDV